MDVKDILVKAHQAGASDVHFTVDKPPQVRVDGDIQALPGFPAMDREKCRDLVYSMLEESLRTRFETDHEADFSFTVQGVGRFRANVLLQRRNVEAVLRLIPETIPKPEDIGLTPAIVALAEKPRGLVLVTGPTGSGKTTTMACLIELINQTQPKHIVTIEDPIEFVYQPKRCLVRQREVGPDTNSFSAALRHAMRQDPDVILLGEMRDAETIALALTAAETGHLCFATLHTQDAAQSVDRIIDVFPANQQNQVRQQLANSIQGVISQTLLPRANGKGRIAAREVLIRTDAVGALIREGKTHQIPSTIETGGKKGMVTLDNALKLLVRRGEVSLVEALSKAKNPERFDV